MCEYICVSACVHVCVCVYSCVYVFMCVYACVHCQFTFSIGNASDWECLACQYDAFCDTHRRVVNNAHVQHTRTSDSSNGGSR